MEFNKERLHNSVLKALEPPHKGIPKTYLEELAVEITDQVENLLINAIPKESSTPPALIANLTYMILIAKGKKNAASRYKTIVQTPWSLVIEAGGYRVKVH